MCDEPTPHEPVEMAFWKCPLYVQQRYADERVAESILGADDPQTNPDNDAAMRLTLRMVWRTLSAETVTWTDEEMQRFDEECAAEQAEREVDRRLGK